MVDAAVTVCAEVVGLGVETASCNNMAALTSTASRVVSGLPDAFLASGASPTGASPEVARASGSRDVDAEELGLGLEEDADALSLGFSSAPSRSDGKGAADDDGWEGGCRRSPGEFDGTSATL
mmetsp:Transcript_33516/g.96227  ORF Transcript_33516/g.96227 Transcript_33516/m.96227 type:complete len:123 (+) Transcript_33516:629-997(+)